MDSPNRTFIQEASIWVQTIGIVIASIWGVYTFLLKEIFLPRSAPVNITIDLQLKKIDRSTSHRLLTSDSKKLTAIEMVVSATNPSSRAVTLFPSIWIAHGLNVEPRQDASKFAQEVTASINENYISQIERHATVYTSPVTPIAVGRLFPDSTLKPNEKTMRRIVFHVPAEEYDLIRVFTSVPSMGKSEGASLEWKYDEKQGFLIATVYRIANNGDREEMKKNKDGEYSDSEFELQSAGSISTLSLWQ